MGPFAQDRRVTTIGGGLNERFGRLEKSAPTTTKSVTTNIQTRTSTSVFSRIQGSNTSSASASPLPPAKRRQGTTTAIQSRIGRVSGGSIQKGVGRAQSNNSSRKPLLTMGTGVSGNRGKQTIKSKAATRAAAAAAAAKHRPKGNRKVDFNSKQKKTKPSSNVTEKGKKKALSADDLDKALDSYMMKDPKTAQARLNDELDSYMDEAGDVLMDL